MSSADFETPPSHRRRHVALRFAGALRQVHGEPVGFVWPDPAAVCVDVVSVPDPETVKYRVHLDLATTSAADGMRKRIETAVGHNLQF